MVKPSSRLTSQTGGVTTKSWLAWTLLLLYATGSHANPPSVGLTHAVINRYSSGIDTGSGSQPSAVVRKPQPGRSPAEIPLLNHDVPTAKFRNTDNEHHNEKYHALAPAQDQSAVRAPPANSPESSGLVSLTPARSLQEWEADDIVLLATIDGSLHARDRVTGRHRWVLEMPDNPMIESKHYRQNRLGKEDPPPSDDYMFIVEPSRDGQLYAQFSNPKNGLMKLPATVKKMADEVPFTMQVNGEYLATSSETQSKIYTLDAETGQILHEFPKHRSSIMSQPQPRCRPRKGLNFQDSACSTGRTIRLGRNTYVFTISNEDTGQDLCTIKFSEWVPNKNDRDLQSQHVASLDGRVIRSLYNGRIIGIDTLAPAEQAHSFTHILDSPVASIFDVLRPADALQEDLSEMILLSRPMTVPAGQQHEIWQAGVQDTRRVFLNQTNSGHWYAMSDSSYPGVTMGAALANVHWNYENQFLDLHGDLVDLVGVHMVSDKPHVAPTRLTIGAPSTDLDVGNRQAKDIAPVPTPQSPDLISRSYVDQFKGSVVGALVIVLAMLLLNKPNLWQQNDTTKNKLQGTIEVHTGPTVDRGDQTPAEIVSGGAALAQPTQTDDQSTAPELTPQHSRVQSTASVAVSPKKRIDSEDADWTALDADSDEDDNVPSENGGPALDDGTAQGDVRKKKKTKRGVRGGRGNKRKKGADTSIFEPKPIISSEKQLKDGLVQVGRLTFDGKLENCLGQGSSGTAVFPGTFDGRQVAVKRLVKSANSLAEKEIRHLVSSDENPHVIRYFGKEESIGFFYIALDRFTTSLDQFVEFPEKYPSLLHPTQGYDVKDALQQITAGVQHIHSLKLVHRDIKPQNILVREVKTARPCPEGKLPPLLFVISDFGLCKPLEDGPDSVFAATRTAAGTTGWKAPELLVSSRDAIAAPSAETPTNGATFSAESTMSTRSTTHSSDGTTIDPPTGRRATKAIDIFSLGCVFFYVMTRGGHPFNGTSPLARDFNIKEGNADTSALQTWGKQNYDFDFDDLVLQMITHNPRERPDTAGVLRHPYFWTAEEKLDFVCAVSDCYEREKNSITNVHDTSPNAARTLAETKSLEEIAALQAKAINVLEHPRRPGELQDFLTALPKSFLMEMGKQRKYTGTKMIDLLRVIRNKKNHFHDLPEDVKEMMMGPDGYYNFWRQRFPTLLVNLYCLLLERNLTEQFGLDRYYDGSLAKRK